MTCRLTFVFQWIDYINATKTLAATNVGQHNYHRNMNHGATWRCLARRLLSTYKINVVSLDFKPFKILVTYKTLLSFKSFFLYILIWQLQHFDLNMSPFQHFFVLCHVVIIIDVEYLFGCKTVPRGDWNGRSWPGVSCYVEPRHVFFVWVDRVFCFWGLLGPTISGSAVSSKIRWSRQPFQVLCISIVVGQAGPTAPSPFT